MLACQGFGKRASERNPRYLVEFPAMDTVFIPTLGRVHCFWDRKALSILVLKVPGRTESFSWVTSGLRGKCWLVWVAPC